MDSNNYKGLMREIHLMKPLMVLALLLFVFGCIESESTIDDLKPTEITEPEPSIEVEDAPTEVAEEVVDDFEIQGLDELEAEFSEEDLDSVFAEFDQLDW